MSSSQPVTPPAGAAVRSGAAVTRLALDPTSWVDVVPGLVPEPGALHASLRDGVAWEQGRVFRYERWIDEPRLGAWQRGHGRHPALTEVEDWIAARYRVHFDALALAHYRDQRDGVAWHRDREMRWLDDTIIAVLTLGARRPWRLRPRRNGSVRDNEDLRDVVELHPASGDLLVMGGRCQADWLHAVPQLRQPCASRISVQWRWTSKTGRRDTDPSYFAPRHFSR